MLVAVNVYVVVVVDPTVFGGLVDIVPALDRFVYSDPSLPVIVILDVSLVAIGEATISAFTSHSKVICFNEDPGCS